MWMEEIRSRAIHVQWIHAVGRGVHVNRHKRVRVPAPRQNWTQAEVERRERGARHLDRRAALFEFFLQRKRNWKRGITLVQTGWTGGADGWMPRVNGDHDTLQRTRLVHARRFANTQNQGASIVDRKSV